MNLSSRYLFLATVLALLCLASCEDNSSGAKNNTKYILCDPAKASAETSEICPLGSKCIEFGAQGACNCPKEMTVNEKFVPKDNNSRYCLNITTTTISTTEAPTTQKVTEKQTVVPTAKPKVETETTTHKSEASTKKVEEQAITEPQVHHLFGGIILPIMVVLAFLGIVFGIRKYDLIERSQNFIRNRRHPQATRYDGLENDFDDDPLLI